MTTAVPTASPRADTGPSAAEGRPSSVRRLVRGRAADPAWVRPGLLGLLAGTGVLYVWGLGGSGWANAFYSAAAQAGAQNWKAFFYGSFDAANSITVDKPPVALWVIGLSVRLFGLSPWSILLPQAVMGVATVGVLYLTVRRVAGPGAGLLAGAIAALTPVAVLMFRFNNPDALLTLLLVLAAYAVTRSVERADARWLVAAGVIVGLGFLTKMLQALLPVPVFALVYLVAAPTSLSRRLLHLLAAGAALVVSSSWWVAIVDHVPASARPYVGGSQTNSVWELIWGYNGLGRLNGDETGSVTLNGRQGFWGPTGLGRMFSTMVGGQVSWLLPAAILLLAGGLVTVRRAPRTDRTRAALVLWGGWLALTAVTFSLMAGIFHPYYTVVLAPAVGALVAIGARLLWPRRELPWVRTVLVAAVAVTAGWAWVLLGRTPVFLPWLRWLILAGGLLAASGLLIRRRLGRAVVVTAVAAGVLAVLGGPAAYAVRTAAASHSGAVPSAGPRLSGPLPPPPPGPSARPGGRPGAILLSGPTGHGGLFPGLPVPFSRSMGSLLLAAQPDPRVTAVLDRNAASYTWVAATVGAESAAGFQLATGRPVLPLGGFNGSDPFPTLAQFQAAVAAGRVHYFIGGGVFWISQNGSAEAHDISRWVTTHYSEQIVDGVVLYDLSRPPSA